MQSINSLDDWRRFFDENDVSLPQKKLLLDYIDGLSSKGFPIIFEFEHLSRLLGYEPYLLARITANTERSYRNFCIPKKRGGYRVISSPYPSLAFGQKWIYEKILSNIDLGPHSYAFRSGRTIIDNAKAHLGCEEILKLDIKGFFESIRIERVIAIFKNSGYTNLVSYHLANICCLNGVLPQGACTSPSLSNIVAKRLDARLYGLVSRLGLNYTRYADDLTISGVRIPGGLQGKIKKICKDEGFIVNNEKTVFKKSGQKKVVTGLCVTGDRVRIPKSYRRIFRKESHNLIKYGIKIVDPSTGKLDPLYAYRVLGKANYILFVEPDNKYAKSVLPELKHLVHGFE